MSVLRHLLIICCYAALAVTIAISAPLWLPAISGPLPFVIAGLVLLAGGLLHEIAVRLAREARWKRDLAGLNRAVNELEDELTWTRREVKAVREAVETLARTTGWHQGSGAVEEVMTEVRVLKSLIAGIAERRPGAPRGQAAKAKTPASSAQEPPAPMPSVSLPVPRVVPPEETGAPRDVLDMVREALRDDRVELVIQPIVALPQRKRVSFECFSRLTAADGTKLLPEQYIALAEQEGLITAIDNMLLFRCIQLVRQIQRKNQDLGFFCNLSPHTLEDADFFGDFVDFLEGNEALAPNLVFEFAQANLARIGTREMAHLKRLTALGSRLSVDQVESLDFNPAELSERGISYIKVDTRFFTGSSSDQEILEARRLIARLNAQDIDLIVEKIEDEQSLVELLDCGMAFGQGYLFGEPRPARQAEKAA